MMDVTTSSGLYFERSSTWWKPYQVYFHMDPNSYLYLLSTVLHYLILARWAMYQVGPNIGAS
jgi:hypothetical protein